MFITRFTQWGAKMWAPLVKMSYTINLYVMESKPDVSPVCPGLLPYV